MTTTKPRGKRAHGSMPAHGRQDMMLRSIEDNVKEVTRGKPVVSRG